MLGDHKDGQPIAYNIIKNEIKNNKLAHAYLFHSDNIRSASSFAFSFAKTLLCPNNYLDNKTCGNCTICRRIDNKNFTELKIIEPDGLWIKKDQLKELQEEFKMKPLEGTKKVYIIQGADKLNIQAANSILKLLEEPAPNIIAILTTDDIHSVLNTITSRCQVIHLRKEENNDIEDIVIDNEDRKTFIKIGKLYYNNPNELNEFISNESNFQKIESIISFIKKYETLKMDIITELKKAWIDLFDDKNSLIWAFDIMILFYKDILNNKLNRKLEIFDDYIEDIKDLASKEDIDVIMFKLKKILLAKEKIKYNINVNLLMDKLVYEMESGELI